MPRPKSSDPKVSTSLRIRASVLATYQAEGKDWRDRMHAALVAGLSGVVARPPVSEPNPKPHKAKVAVAKSPKPAGRLVGFTTSGEPIYRK